MAKRMIFILSVPILLGLCREYDNVPVKPGVVVARKEREAFFPTLPLVYPFGGTFKFQYSLPPNTTFLMDYYNSFSSRSPESRRTRRFVDRERATAYQFLETELEKWGAESGRECLLKNICEAAMLPFDIEAGLLEELLHLLLTPDYGGNSTVDEDYSKAAETGRSGGNCSEIYATCGPGFGFLDRIMT